MPSIEEKPVDFRTWVGVLGTMLGAFMVVLDIQITNSSLRDITVGSQPLKMRVPGSQPAT